MPVLRSYPNGAAYSRPHAGTPPTVIRGKTTGWNKQTGSRFNRFLMSIDVEKIYQDGGQLYGFTLTIAQTPATPEDWSSLRDRWLKRLSRRLPHSSVIWLTEFQRRGTPHLHGVIAALPGDAAAVDDLVGRDWPELANVGAEKATRAVAQYVTPLHKASGWLQYMTKHLQRGSAHYQRATLPEGWEKSGRIWGSSKGWPTSETVYRLSNVGWFELRRLMHSYAWAQTASLHLPDRVRARKYLAKRKRAGGRESSAFIGGSEWVPPEVQQRMIDWLISQGFYLVNEATGEIHNSPF